MFGGIWAMIRKLVLALAATVGLSTGAIAQEEWEFSGTLYIFAADSDLDLADVSADISFSDALDNLDMAFYSVLQGRKGKWGFLIDVAYIDLTFKEQPESALIDRVKVGATLTTATGFASYRLYDTPTVSTDLMVGLRYFKARNELDINTIIGPGVSDTIKDSWVDPVIGFRTIAQFGNNWSGTLFADYGGWDDRETYQIYAAANYEFSNDWVASFGVRWFNVKNDDFDDGGETFKLEQFGPMVGISYRF